MARTFKDLVLALLNATLILIALCLFLGLMVVNRANAITETFTSNLIKLDPLRSEVADTRAEVAGLRADLADLRNGSGDLSAAVMERMQSRMESIDTRVDAMQAALQGVKNLPYELTDHAIEKTAAEISGQVQLIRGCTAPVDADT